MSATVDERIVAAKFDASDFEKGVNKTIKKLDELKKSLNMKETTKSVNELSEKVKTSTDSMSGSLEKLTNRLTTFTGMIKQNILSGLAQEVSDVFLKMERAVTGFIRSLGSEQISVGMQKYEQMLTSVRTMMAAGESQNSAYGAIEELRDYSDQTSYSLSQMTDALSKFRAAGTHLDEATRSVQGIANACAIAGINATDAGRAYYNLAQAYSSGTLKYTDYRSLELLNMTTEKFKQNLLEAAEEAGTLKKLSDGTYKTIKHQGDKITAGKKVTIKNIQDALRYGFVTKNVLNKLFGEKYYFSEKEFKKYKDRYTDKYGNLDEAGREKAIADAKKDYNEFAVDAYLAAREARNFTDVMNTLKDVVSTGWSTTFEYLFGKLESATKFFTELTEGPLADVIYKIGEYRNAILGYWNNVGNAAEGTGAKMFQNTILNIAEAIGTLLRTFQQILPGFDELDNKEGEQQKTLKGIGEKLKRVSADIMITTLRISNAMKAFNDWMNSPIIEGGPTRIETIRKTIANLMSVFSIAYRVFEIGFNAIIKVATAASPIFDALSIAFEKVTEPLTDLKNNDKPFKDMEHSANNIIIALQPIIDGLSAILGIAGEIGKFFVSMTIDTAVMNLEFFSDVLRFFIDIFTGGKSSQSLKEGESTLDKIAKAFESIKTACQSGLSAVREFLGSLIKDLKTLFGITDENEEKIQNGGFFENLAKFFETNEFVKNAKAWIDQAILDVTNWIKDIPNKIHSLGANIYNTLYGLFFKDETKYNGSQLETKTILTPLGEWMDKAIKDIVNFFVTLPDKIIKGVGDVFNWVNEIFDYFFGKRTEANDGSRGYTVMEYGNNGWEKAETITIWSRFDEFVDNVVSSIRAWFNDLPNKIHNALSSIGDFATKLINTIDEFLFGRKATYTKKSKNKYGATITKQITVRYKSGFSKWLDDLIKEVKKFIAKIPEYIKEGIKGAGDIISSIVNALFGTEDQSTSQDASKKVEEGIKKPFLGIDWNSIWNTIKDIGTTLLNQIARIFTGTDDVEYNANWFAETVAKGISWISEKATSAFNTVLLEFPKIPEKIAALFSGEGTTETDQDKGPVGKSISEFISSIGTFIAGIPGAIWDFIKNAISTIDKYWQQFYESVTNPSALKKTEYAENEMGYPASFAHDSRTGEKQKNAWEKFIGSLGETISTVIQTLPKWIVQGIDLAVQGINSAFTSLTGWITDAINNDKIAEAAEEAAKGTVETTAEATNDAANGEGESELLKALKNLGLSIYNMFTKTIPPLITSAFTWIGSKASKIWDGIVNIFNGTPEEGWQTAISTFAGNIRNWFETDLKDAIKNGIKTVTTFISSLFKKKEVWAENDRGYPVSYAHSVVDSMNKSFEEAGEDVKKSNGATSLITQIKEGLLSAFESIGPTVLTGITKALNWISKVSGIVIGLLTGNTDLNKEIKKAYGEEKPELVNALTNFGASLKKFILETLPKLLGSIVAEVAKYSSEFFTNLVGGFNDGMVKASKDTEAVGEDGADSLGKIVNPDDPQDKDTFIGKLLGVFETIGKIASSGEAQGIVMIFALAYLLKQLKQALSVADELDAAAGVVKWAAITLAVLGISSVLSSIMEIVKEGDPDKIAAAERILDKIGGVMTSLAWVVGLMSAGKVATALSDIFGKKGQTGVVSIDASQSKDAMISVNNFVEGANQLGGVLKSGLTKAAAGAGTGLGAWFAGMGIKAAVEDIADGLMTSFTTLMTGIDSFMNMLNPFIDKVTEAGDKIDTAKEAVNKIFDLFTHMFTKFSDLYESVGGKEIKDMRDTNQAAGFVTNDQNGNMVNSPTKLGTAIKAFMSDFSEILSIYTNIGQFINTLTDAIIKINDVDSIESKIEKIRDMITSPAFNDLLAKVFNFTWNLMENLQNGGYNLVDIKDLSNAFSVLSNVMSIITDTLVQVDSDTSNNISAGFDTLERIANVFNGGDKNLVKLSSNIASFGSHMRNFYGYVKDIEGFDDANAEATSRKISSMIEIIRECAKSAELLYDFGEGFESLSYLGGYLGELGGNYAAFMEGLNNAFPTDISKDRLGSLTAITSAVSSVISSFGQLGYLWYNGYSNVDYANIIDQMYTKLGDFVKNSDANKFAEVAGKLQEIIATPLTTQEAYTEYHTTGADIARELYAGIQAALDDPTNNYHPTITPVISSDALSNVRKYFINSGITPQFNTDASFSFNAQTDEKLNKIQETLTSIDGRLEDMNKNSASVGDFTSALSGLQIVANTGALVGVMTPAIDKAIGDRVWLLTRKNSLGA